MFAEKFKTFRFFRRKSNYSAEMTIDEDVKSFKRSSKEKMNRKTLVSLKLDFSG